MNWSLRKKSINTRVDFNSFNFRLFLIKWNKISNQLEQTWAHGQVVYPKILTIYKQKVLGRRRK
jgi:hypothetical protein